MKRLVFTVTNDLAYDQRMIRICTSLAGAGYDVLLVGRQYAGSPELPQRPFRQKRLSLFFKKGKLFYLEYNVRLFLYLLSCPADLLCAIDLDTILPVLYASKIKGCKRVYDAHELFCEMKEVVSRPAVYKVWKWIEEKTVPQFRLGYTVNNPIREILQQQYGVQYQVIRNMPLVQQDFVAVQDAAPFILYQGAVNEGRSFETLIPAFKWIPVPLWIVGDGNFLERAKTLVQEHGLEQQVIFKGKLLPEELRQLTPKATLGITLFENKGLSNYYSLANRFFDYIQAGVPQLCVDYPVYREINEQYEIAVLTQTLDAASLAEVINQYLKDTSLQQRLRANCLQARQVLNWQGEEQTLLSFYQNIFA